MGAEKREVLRKNRCPLRQDSGKMVAFNTTTLTSGDAHTKAQLCLSPESELPRLANECVIYRDGAKIDAVWTKWRFAEICWLMLNGNDPHFFLSVWPTDCPFR